MLKSKPIQIVRDFSYSAAKTYVAKKLVGPSFIWVDGCHAQDAVMRDLHDWWPLLVPGGIIGGSTFLDDMAHQIGVKTAVLRFTAAVGATPLAINSDSTPPKQFWYIQKPSPPNDTKQ